MARTKQNQVGKGKNQGNTTPQTAIEAFDDFLDSFIKKSSYVLKSNEAIFKKDNINKTFELFCKNSQDDKNKDKNFNDVFKAPEKEDDIIIDILNHAIWLWALPNARKTSWVLKDYNNDSWKKRYKDELLQVDGVAGGGSGYVQTKTNGVRFILYLFTKMQEADDTQSIKNNIEKACKPTKGDKDIYSYPLPDGVKNLLLYLCKPNDYQPIASTSDKKKIVKTFWEDIPNGQRPNSEEDALDELDNTLKTIKEEVFEKNASVQFSSFYQGSLPLLWKGESITDLSLVQQLEYKKAMILYGPPGTSKTHTARELAKQIILRHVMRKDKQKAIDLLKNLSGIEDRINYLQFHININYEDFIAGQTIQNNSAITQRGFIYDVIEKAQKPFKVKRKAIDDAPYVVILDEINRTDISRVFGELFTAIEKRGVDVDLLLPEYDQSGKITDKKLKLNIPDNIYFIGTMNEIDFSLERVDFALRRRFIWELHDYDKDTLDSMMLYKLGNKQGNISEEEFNDYCNACTKLNIEVERVMGEAYHIGHTFFAEIVDIYNELINNKTTAQKPWEKAKIILWQISIKPTLEAYCGTMDKAQRETYLKQNDGLFYKAFFK